ncbi:MAG: LacI family transcriptional regulator [Lachnospiraceae bacterium]|nr:LacI family transcriptional regulator [Lachnospiraceae bacterium]
MQNKVTAKDVAKQAGVSVATVSYVLNGRTDQKISAETKKKILQIANLLNYVPSHAAKSLATGRNNAIGIAYSLSDSPTKNAGLSHFANLLTERLMRLHYDVVMVPAKRVEDGVHETCNVDAIIAIDLDQNDFRGLADSYLVPVICVDMVVGDPLFFQIYEDIPYLIEKAFMELKKDEKYYFIYDSFENTNYEDYILSLPDNVFPLRKRDLTPSVMEKLSETSIIVLGVYLGLSLLTFLDKNKTCIILSEDEQSLVNGRCHTIINNENKKANLTINIVTNALSKHFDIKHDNPIR